MTQPGPGNDPRPQAGGGVSTARLWPRTHPNHVTAPHAVRRPSPGPRHAAPQPASWSSTAVQVDEDVEDVVESGRHATLDGLPSLPTEPPAPATWTPQSWQPPASTAYGYPGDMIPPPPLGYAPVPYPGSTPTRRSYERVVKLGATAAMLAVVVALAGRADRPFDAYRAGRAIGMLVLVCLAVWVVRRVYRGPQRRQRNVGFGQTEPASVRGLIVWVSALALLTTAGVIEYNRLSPSDRTVVLPSSFGPYTKVTNPALSQLMNAMRTKLPGNASKAPVAVYALPGATPAIVVVAVYADLGGDVAREFDIDGPNAIVLAIFDGGAVKPSDLEPYAPGPLGGVLKCGTGVDNSTPFVACAWADASTAALVIDVSPDADINQLAANTLKLRAAAEQWPR